MKRNIFWPILNVLIVVMTITVNILANALPINGQNTGEISDRFQVFFVPAGYVFAIWGLIYIGLISYAIYQALPSQRDNPRLGKADPFFFLSGVANSAWIFAWHYNNFPLSLAIMLVLLLSLITIYQRLEVNRVKVSTAERWMVQIPMSVYLGWISVATIANVTDVLYDVGWSGWGITPQAWAVIMLVIATVLGALMAISRRDIAYLLVFVWSFIGIALKQADTALVAGAAWAATIAVIVLVGYSLLHSLRQGQKTVTA